MTHIRYERERDRLRFCGHAGAGRKGGDIVCAALSMLMYTLRAIPGARAELGEGWCTVTWPPSRRREAEAVVRGCRLLAKEESNYVDFEEGTWTKNK